MACSRGGGDGDDGCSRVDPLPSLFLSRRSVGESICASSKESILSLLPPNSPSKVKFKSRLRFGFQLVFLVRHLCFDEVLCLRGLVRGASAFGDNGASSSSSSPSRMTSLWYPESSASSSSFVFSPVIFDGALGVTGLSSFVIGPPYPRSATPPLLAKHRWPLQSSHGRRVSTACSCCLTFQQGLMPAWRERVAAMQCCQIVMVCVQGMWLMGRMMHIWVDGNGFMNDGWEV
jgi:hypothetical protein